MVRTFPFAHASGIRELQEGQGVTFGVTQGKKGPQTQNITPA
ncbi:cold-shock protein [Streptomyces sp. NPDC055607]